MLHGRETERAQLAALLDAARRGTAGSIVVQGEPGVGKSALLAEVTSTVADVRVLRTQGLESESPLAFAALHRLLRPVLDLVDGLPAPQAHALRVAFGQEAGSAEPFLVAVATLSMLTEAAEDQPLVCVVDDAHWLDAASADALLFATRRLDADPVAMVFAARTATTGPSPRKGCRPAAARAGPGLGAGAPRRTVRRSRCRPRSATGCWPRRGGNPLALVELPTRPQ